MNIRKTSYTSKNNPWLILVVSTIGVLLFNIDMSIVNIALPTIAKDYTTTINKVQWVVSGYIVSICVLLPIFGKLSDVYTKRLFYLVGFAIFTLSSVLCAMATNITMLVLFRVLQGIAAALMVSSNHALIIMNFPQNLRGRALGINTMMGSFGVIIGPALGGLLLGSFSWRSIFYVNLPIGIIGCILGYYILPCNEKTNRQSLDIIGTVLLAVIITSSLLFMNNISSLNFVTIYNFSLLFMICSASYFFAKNKAENPILDTSLFKSKEYLLGNISAFIVFMGMGGSIVLLPFYLQNILHFDPHTIGLLMLVSPLVMLVLAPMSGYLADKFSHKILVAIGLLLLMFGLFSLGMLNSATSFSNIILCQIIIGCGFATFQSPNNYGLFKNVPTEKLGVASGINAFSRNIGRVFGIVVATTIFTLLFTSVLAGKHSNSNDNVAFLCGFKYACFCLAIFMLVAFCLTVRFRFFLVSYLVFKNNILKLLSIFRCEKIAKNTGCLIDEDSSNNDEC